jgi:hypothetical protein
MMQTCSAPKAAETADPTELPDKSKSPAQNSTPVAGIHPLDLDAVRNVKVQVLVALD